MPWRRIGTREISRDTKRACVRPDCRNNRGMLRGDLASPPGRMWSDLACLLAKPWQGELPVWAERGWFIPHGGAHLSSIAVRAKEAKGILCDNERTNSRH